MEPAHTLPHRSDAFGCGRAQLDLGALNGFETEWVPDLCFLQMNSLAVISVSLVRSASVFLFLIITLYVIITALEQMKASPYLLKPYVAGDNLIHFILGADRKTFNH